MAQEPPTPPQQRVVRLDDALVGASTEGRDIIGSLAMPISERMYFVRPAARAFHYLEAVLLSSDRRLKRVLQQGVAFRAKEVRP